MKYGILKGPEMPQSSIDLVRIPHKGKPLIISPAFGPSHLKGVLDGMTQGSFYNSEQFPDVRFRKPLIQESISALVFEFESGIGPRTLDLGWLYAGEVMGTEEGIFTNTRERNTDRLKQLLNGTTKVNGIYLINDKIAFAPFESFETGAQEGREFAEGGLARALEHTETRVAEDLLKILSTENYPRGISISGFDMPGFGVSRDDVKFKSDGYCPGRLVLDGGRRGGGRKDFSFGVYHSN